MTPEGENEGERDPKKKNSGKLEKRGFVRRKGELTEKGCRITERAGGLGTAIENDSISGQPINRGARSGDSGRRDVEFSGVRTFGSDRCGMIASGLRIFGSFEIPAMVQIGSRTVI